MARTIDKSKAIALRRQGKSYSEIKKELGISKSTLSGWLADMPLSPERIRELRDNSAQRIESYRNTMMRKRREKFEGVYNVAKKDIATLSKREIILCGLFLYWGEGGKSSSKATVALSNTDPSMLKFYLEWLRVLNVPFEKLTVTLQLYADMDQIEAMKFWSDTLNLPLSCFKKTYIKESKLSDLSYKNGFGHGTCMIRYGNEGLKSYVMASLKYIGDLYT